MRVIIAYIFIFGLVNFLYGQSTQEKVNEVSRILPDSTIIKFEFYYMENSLYKIYIYESDVLKSVGFTKDKDKIENIHYVGFFQSFHKNGKVRLEGEYNYSHLHEGEWKEYYESGQLLSIKVCKNGLLSGKYICYYESGGLKEKGEFGTKEYRIDNKLHIMDSKIGFWTAYHPNGTKECEGNYWFGAIIEFTNDEYKEQEQKYGVTFYPQYRQDMRHGYWSYWNDKGLLEKKEEYYKGILIQELKIEEQGIPPRE